MTRVAVVGGGISGLAAAHRLRTLLGPSAEIVVLEQRDRLGGVLRTVDLAGVPFDVGAEAFLARRPEMPALLDELGLASAIVHPTAATATIRAGSRTVGLPRGTLMGVPGAGATLDEVLSSAGLAAVELEPSRPLHWDAGSDVALGALLRDRFGDEVADRIADPLLGGVYAGRVDGLGVRATVPALAAALDAGAPSVTAAATAGMTTSGAPGGTLSAAPRGTEGPSGAAPRGTESSSGGTLAASRSSGSSEAASRATPAPGGHTGPSGGTLAAGPRPAPGSPVGQPAAGAHGSREAVRDGRGAGAPDREHASGGAAPPPAAAGPVFGAVRGGYRVVLDALAAASAATVRTGTTVRSLERTPHGWRLVLGPVPAPETLDADAVVLAVPAPAVRRLLDGVVPAGSEAASGIELASSAVVALAFRGTDVAAPSTSGCLIASDEPLSIKGLTHSSTKWTHLGDDGVVRLRMSAGRFGEAAALQIDDDELVARARADLRELDGIDAEPVDVHVRRWGGGLPQYAVGHLDRVAALESAVAGEAGLAVAGAALHGVGVPACVGTARAAAERVAAGLTAGRRA
ncbi:protoporphyrinogen oxidase [Pseudonocardia endophytica]|uniref:Coproporphyrinogen III oxidase n=1 Tax=Pseudonocardia endophytica TaxID=401976 RepID=A0A4R1HQT8_PSEEN|nr:protoporphyrinogen oxidase [Pseudonocardia endophytica]TCK24937.1 protoporphyrinogen oxidase [Pseudonocardia endophytica]